MGKSRRRNQGTTFKETVIGFYALLQIFGVILIVCIAIALAQWYLALAAWIKIPIDIDVRAP